MDNLTHTLIGLAAGEALLQSRKTKPSQAFRGLSLGVSVAANNIADLDTAIRWFGHQPLLALIHHRGYSHSFAALIPSSCIIVFFALCYSWIRRFRLTSHEVASLWCLALLGGALHIFADFWNSYGVHPLWPWDNHWYYGDFIFIVEPWLWCTLLPSLYGSAESKTAKWLYGFISIAIVGIILSTGYLVLFLRIALLLWFALQWFGLRLPNKQRIWLSLGLVSLILLGFASVSLAVKRQLRAAVPPNQWIADIVANPLPANPFCWQGLVVSYSKDGFYQASLARVSPFGQRQSCQLLTMGNGGSVPLATMQSQSKTVEWIGAYRMEITAAQNLYAQNCWARALAGFLRVPFIVNQEGHPILGDLRFARAGRQNFSAFLLDAPAEDCPSSLPPWIPPREELWNANAASSPVR